MILIAVRALVLFIAIVAFAAPARAADGEMRYTYGTHPGIDDLFSRQTKEPDPKKREQLVHQIQKIITDQTLNIPLYELAFIWGVGPRVEESGAGLIPGYAYSAPAEDLKLKT
jgi:peptide/nickel transport system substrate-binding protein